MRRLLVTVGHYATAVTGAALAALAVYFLAGDRRVPSDVCDVVLVAYLVVTLGGVLHSRSPFACGMCVRLPVGGADMAARRDRSLRAYHHIVTGPRGRFALVAAIPLAFIAWAVLFRPTGLALAVNRAGLAAALAVMAAALLLMHRHTQVALWCRYCRDDDGDDDAPARPDPVGPGTARPQ